MQSVFNCHMLLKKVQGTLSMGLMSEENKTGTEGEAGKEMSLSLKF